MAQYGRPDSDVSTGNWTANGGPSSLYGCLNEATPDDNDYCEEAGSLTTMELGLSDMTDPVSSSGHIVRWRWMASGGGAKERVTVRLRQGTTTTIAICGLNVVVGRDAYEDKSYTLTTGEADAITDYSDLRLDFKVGAQGGSEYVRVSWAEFEIPDAGGPPTYYHGLTVQGIGELALCDVGSHPLRIRKGGTTYGIELVDTSDPNASVVRIKTPGGVKAIRKYASGPEAGYDGLMKITVDSYTSLKSELVGYGPFWPYGWVVHDQIGNFDSQLAKVEDTLGDSEVEKRAILFSCVDDIEAKVSQIPAWIDTIWYTTEPSYTPEYDDIFLEDENNSVVRAVVAGHAYGFDVGWGPLPGSFDWHSGIAASDAVLNLLNQAGLDHAYMQYQSRIGSDCPDILAYGPLAGADTVQEAVDHLHQFIPDIDVGCQVAPAGCTQGDALSCPDVEDYCCEFLVLSKQVGTTYAGIWVPDAATIQEIRG